MDDGVMPRGWSYAVAALGATALWLPTMPSSHWAKEALTPAGKQRCDRTLSPRGRITITRAVHARKRIRTLCLRGGVYTEGEVWLRRRGMTIMSVPGQRAVWRGRIVVRARNVTLERLTLDGTGRGRYSLPSPTINGAGFTLRESDVSNRTGICVHPLTYGGLTPRSFTIERNRIHDCGRHPRTNQDHGIYVAGGSGVIRWNAIFDNADRGVQLYPAARGVRVSNNTIDGNGEGINFGAGASDNLVTNNLITNSRVRWNVEFYDLYGHGNEVRANCLRADPPDSHYGARGGIADGIDRVLKVEGNVSADVQYADRAAHDLRHTSDDAFCASIGAPAEVAGRSATP